MASVEGLAKVQGLIQGTNDQLDQQLRMQAAKQSAELFQQGDIKGALSNLARHDPEHAASLIQQFQQFDPTYQQALRQGQVQGQTQGEYNVTTPAGSNPRQLLDTQIASQEKIAEMNAEIKQQAKAAAPSVAENAVDKAFAKEYTDFVAKGGYADVKKNIDSLKSVASELGKTDTATGGFIGLLPKVVRDVVTPEGAALQDNVEEVIQRNLRLVLGAQFTEREGQMLMARAYNPRLSEKENRSRVIKLADQIESAANQQKAAARYFEDNGTLKGYKGKIIASIDDIVPPPADKNQQALEFIAANPNDPRVPAIRKKLGL